MRYLIAVLCALAVVITQVLYGGAMRPIFALPGLFLVGVAGALGIVAVFWRNVPAPSFWAVSSVLVFAGWLIWRELESPDPWLAAGYLRLTLGCLIMYLVFACVVTNPFHRLTYICALLLAALLQAGIAAWQFARPETGALIPWLSEQLRIWYAPKMTGRGHGSYLNANHLVWFLNVAAFFSLSLVCWGRWGLKAKIVCMYVALASIAGVVVTLSRGGLLGFCAGLAVFLLLSAIALAVGARNRRFVTSLIVLAVVVVAASAGFFLIKGSATAAARFSELGNDDYRAAVFEAVRRQAQLQPLLGTGAGTFIYFGRRYREMNYFSDDIYAHNDWMQMLGDFGFPALALLVLVVCIHARTGLSGLVETLRKRMSVHSRPQSHAAAILIGALASLGVFVAHSFFDFNMQIPSNALLASSCLGMLANPGALSHASVSRLSGIWRRVGCGAGIGAATWLIVLTVGVAKTEANWLLAENAYLRGQLKESLEYVEKGLALGPHSRLDRLAGDVLFAAARNEPAPEGKRKWAIRAERHYQLSWKLNSWDFATLARLRDIQRFLGRRELAEKSAIEVIALSPLQGRSLEAYAELLEENGRLAEALHAYMLAQAYYGSEHAGDSVRELRRKLLILSP